MVKYTLKQCYYFKAVADHGGIAQAARALNLSQPAIAQALNKLESMYDFKLFIRHHSQGVELTPQGRELYLAVANTLTTAQDLERNMHLIADDQLATLRLGCFHTLAPFYMIPIVRHYQQNVSKTKVIAQEMFQEELLEKLSSGDLDAGITYDMSLQDSTLKQQKIVSLTPHVILSQDHPLASCTSLHAQQLANFPFIMFDGAGSKNYYNKLLEELDIRPNTALISRSMETVRSAVGNNLGFSFTLIRPQTSRTYDGKKIVTLPLAQTCSPLSVLLLISQAAAQSSLIRNLEQECNSLFSTRCKA